MITVPSVVQEIVQQSPFIEHAIAQEIINLSSYARTIHQEVEEQTMKEVQMGSIVMALKRLQPKLRTSDDLKIVLDSQPELIVRSNLFEVTIAKDQNSTNIQKKLLDYASNHAQKFTTITHGVFETTIVASQDTHNDIFALIDTGSVVYHKEQLSSITIKFSVNIVDVPGIYYVLLKALAWEGIDIVEVVSTYSELTIILKDGHVDESFRLVKKLFS